MSLSRGRFTTGSTLRQYVLIEKLADDVVGTVWKAEDSALGRLVAIKLLHPEVTANPAQRELIALEARHAAHLDHPCVARIYELDRIDDDLFLVFEHVEGEPLNRLVRGKALGREWFLRIAGQIAEAMHAAHAAEVIHGNLHGSDILVAEDGRIKIVGFGTGRASAAGGPVAEETDEAERAYYLSPERVIGKTLQATSDVFSIGTIFYEMATGNLPFPGQTPAEVCEKIVSRPPPAPALFNPSIDPAIITIIGRCIQKDPARRYQSTAHLVADLQKMHAGESLSQTGRSAAVYGDLSPPAPAPALEPAAISATLGEALDLLQETAVQPDGEHSDWGEASPQPAAADVAMMPAGMRHAVIFYASLPPVPGSGDLVLEPRAGVMQQILGEAVYLHNGRIVDPFGSRIIAEFDDPRRALAAARKGQSDLENYNRTRAAAALQIPARLVVHCGAVKSREGSFGGPAVEAAQSAAPLLAPLTPAVSAAVLNLLEIALEGEPIVTVTGTSFYALPEEERIPPLEQQEENPAVVEPELSAAEKWPYLVPASIAAGIVLVLVLIGGYVLRDHRIKAAEREREQQRAAAEALAAAAEPPTSGPRQLAIDPFWSEVSDATIAAPGDTIRLAVIGMLEGQGNLRVVDSPVGSERFSATLRQGAAGLEMVPVRIAPQSAQGVPLVVNDAAVAAHLLAAWISERLQVVPPSYSRTTPATIELFARAVGERRSTGGRVTPQLEELARALARSDPNFAPGQMLALDVFETIRDDAAATAAARAILALDPRNIDVRKRHAAILARTGGALEALDHFIAVLRERPEDIDALRAIGTYALAANDGVVFEKAMNRLSDLGGTQELHPPDLLLVAGRIDQAATRLFELQDEDANNPALSLKIGRVAVMRRMMTISDIELGKLRETDPSFGYPLLNAYILAERQDRAGAAVELQRALGSARWFDLPHTHAAEVHALLGNSRGVIEALERAVANGEPSGSYILKNPLFSYLGNDPRFRRLRPKIESQIAEIGAALTSAPL
jgi:tetratricopeptide (TPR) repeat protein